MKELVLALTIAIISIGYTSDLKGQTYLRKAEAVQNLAREAKYTTALIGQLQDENQAIMHRNRLRLIVALLHELKRSESVKAAADRYLPSTEINTLQVGVGRFVPPSQDADNHLDWLRRDLMGLLTY